MIGIFWREDCGAGVLGAIPPATGVIFIFSCTGIGSILIGAVFKIGVKKVFSVFFQRSIFSYIFSHGHAVVHTSL